MLREFWLSERADEPGAAAIRCEFERIEPEKGSATGYLAKYVAKSIDGAGKIGAAEDHETGATAGEGVVRVDAWASTHGIRQFQQKAHHWRVQPVPRAAAAGAGRHSLLLGARRHAPVLLAHRQEGSVFPVLLFVLTLDPWQ